MFRTSILSGWLTWTLLLAASLSIVPPTGAIGQEDRLVPSSIAIDIPDLQQQLEKGLRVRRPEEFAFVALVVRMVENDTLPLSLVKSTFLWARKKGASTRYPFPYFERAIRVRAAKQGIQIP